jgi:excisionase family DNA binding protein
MTDLEQLRQAVTLLPAGASVTLTRETLLGALGASADVCNPVAGDLTVAELAAQFHRSPSTVRAWLEAGRFPGAYKLRDRDWRVPRAAITAFVEQQRAPAHRAGAADLGAWRQHRRPA